MDEIQQDARGTITSLAQWAEDSLMVSRERWEELHRVHSAEGTDAPCHEGLQTFHLRARFPSAPGAPVVGSSSLRLQFLIRFAALDNARMTRTNGGKRCGWTRGAQKLDIRDAWGLEAALRPVACSSCRETSEMCWRVARRDRVAGGRN